MTTLDLPETTPAGDFAVHGFGSLALLVPLTPGAREWADVNLPADALTYAGGIAIEARYVAAIVDGAVADGLVVGWQP